MSLIFFNNPFKESDHSILNNSILDKHNHENDYCYHPLASYYPYCYNYHPFAYHPYPQFGKSCTNTQKLPSKINNNTKDSKKQSTCSFKPFKQDTYKLVDFRPKNTLCEDNHNYYIQLDLPGMSKDQIHMELSEDNVLTISGERKDSKYKPTNRNPNMKVSKMECEYGKFSRSFSIPDTANFEKISAKMENGSLEVIIPKAEPPNNQCRIIHVQ